MLIVVVCVLSLSLVEDGVEGLVTLLPKESVFWEPFAAGPVELRVRRVAGMLPGEIFVGV